MRESHKSLSSGAIGLLALSTLSLAIGTAYAAGKYDLLDSIAHSIESRIAPSFAGNLKFYLSTTSL